MLQSESELIALLEEVTADYDAGTQFFAERQLPETVVVTNLSLSGRNLSLFLTLSCLTDHVHTETRAPKRMIGNNGLWAVCGNLWRQHNWVFDTEAIEERGRKRLRRLFGKLEQMDRRDADWWYQTATWIRDEHESNPEQLLETAGYDAREIEQRVRLGGPQGLRSMMILPTWLRLMHDEVHELDRFWLIPLPESPHLVSLMNRLSQREFHPENDTVRAAVQEFWQLLCREHNFTPLIVDKASRLLEYHWKQGGETYIKSCLSEIRAVSE